LRLLIDRIVLTPDADAPGGHTIELYGDIATILNLAATPLKPSASGKEKPSGHTGAEGLLSVVAGARNHLYRTRLNAPSRR